MIPDHLETLARQGLLGRRPAAELDALLRRLVGLQAQIPSSPGLMLAARVEGVTPRTVPDLLARRVAVRIWAMRGTLHLVRVADIPLLQAAVLDDWVPTLRGWTRRHAGLTPRTILRHEATLLRELERGPRTRAQLVLATGLHPIGWGFEIRSLACQGLVVPIGRVGSETLFDLTRRWLPRLRRSPLRRDEALVELARRYLAGYAPATVQDFAFWLGVRVSDVRAAFEAAGPAEAPPPAEGRPTPRLLPRFDVAILAHRDKSRWMTLADRKRVFLPAAVVEAVALVDGRVAGTWAYGERFRPTWFRRVSLRDRAALAREHARLGPFLAG